VATGTGTLEHSIFSENCCPR